MIDLKRFYSETQRCLKHERSEQDVYDGLAASRAVASVFVSFNKGLGELPNALASYWMDTYIKSAEDLSKEPTQEHIDWLASILTLIEGEFENHQDFSQKDWEEIRSLADSEAEDLPIDVLQNIMTVLVERKKL